MVDAQDSDELEPGDHLRARRWSGLYTHHGLYVGNGRVVEFGGRMCEKPEAIVREVSLKAFADSDPLEVVSYGQRRRLAPWFPIETLPRDERVERARFLVGNAVPGRYNLIGHNCEHVAAWCVTGFPESAQVRAGLWVNMVVGGAFTLAVSRAIRSRKPLPSLPIFGVVLVRLWLVWQYHYHAGRFVREIDRAWRSRTACGSPVVPGSPCPVCGSRPLWRRSWRTSTRARATFNSPR